MVNPTVSSDYFTNIYIILDKILTLILMSIKKVNPEKEWENIFTFHIAYVKII